MFAASVARLSEGARRCLASFRLLEEDERIPEELMLRLWTVNGADLPLPELAVPGGLAAAQACLQELLDASLVFAEDAAPSIGGSMFCSGLLLKGQRLTLSLQGRLKPRRPRPKHPTGCCTCTTWCTSTSRSRPKNCCCLTSPRRVPPLRRHRRQQRRRSSSAARLRAPPLPTPIKDNL